ncbi:Olfactory receptor 51E1 [Larimichthys crocea]|uniref:Olfactory receptor n=1 Tax=Larimichthys crocea TaxID=215358 RepID=A0A0F8BQI3_LARCR|nr:olfactory receptor 2AG2 [Larimichthys crocea]KAE8277780.1 Olfactory receptor 51E1 [Larimichthys crocea]
MNVTSVTSLTLVGLEPVSAHGPVLFAVLCSVYVFVLCSDSLVVYLICSQNSLRRPMFAFVAAVLLNSLCASTALYPKLLADVLWSRGSVQVSRAACLGQAFVVISLGASSFLLLAAMAADRYLSICRPLRYAALVTPAFVWALLLLCWLLPATLVGGAVLLASRLPLCRSRLRRLYCDVYSLVRLSCGGRAALQSELLGLLLSAGTVALPAGFVLFSYGRVLTVCLRRSRAFSSRALHTCLPHLLVFVNYSVSTGIELLQRRLQAAGEPSIVPSFLVVMIPTVMNPVVYGLKMKEVRRHIERLLGCQRAAP